MNVVAFARKCGRDTSGCAWGNGELDASYGGRVRRECVGIVGIGFGVNVGAFARNRSVAWE